MQGVVWNHTGAPPLMLHTSRIAVSLHTTGERSMANRLRLPTSDNTPEALAQLRHANLVNRGLPRAIEPYGCAEPGPATPLGGFFEPEIVEDTRPTVTRAVSRKQAGA